MINGGIKKAKRSVTVDKPILYEGKNYKRKIPTGWGSHLKVTYCPDFGNVEKVERVMTREDREQMKSYIQFLEFSFLTLDTKDIKKDKQFGPV